MSKQRDKDADDLLRRAYALRDQDEALTLYRDWADGYDRSMLDGLHYASPRRAVEHLLRFLDAREQPILDVGCGTGLAGAVLHELGCTALHGIDLSSDMLRVANARGIYQSLRQADLSQPLPIADDRYHAAVCTGTFTHAHVDASCLPELFRVIRPGGLFAFTVHLDVWQPMGFESTLESMTHDGTIALVDRFEDSYFEDAADPEGHYCVYRRA